MPARSPFGSQATSLALAALGLLGGCRDGAQAPAPVASAGTDQPAATALTSTPAAPSYERKNFPDQAGACRSTERPTGFACEFDTDCVICHDGSDCGVVVNRAELAHRGAACTREDAAECEETRPRCCAGKCARAPH